MPACPFCLSILTHRFDVDRGCCAECRVAIERILVEECGADPEDVRDVWWNWPGCVEWRFMGNLGFGGKIWWRASDRRLYVTCYSEDATPDRIAAIKRADARLGTLVKEIPCPASE